MLNIIISIVFTLLAVLLISSLFISSRLNLPISFSNFLILLKLFTFQFHDDHHNIKNKIHEERCDNVEGEDDLEKVVLRKEMMPRHVAVIMDGNRRWAKKAGLSTSQGHEAGGKRLTEFLEICFSFGIGTVSVFAFSTENWRRDKDEIDGLMSVIENHLSDLQFFQKEEIRVSVIGSLEKVPESLLRTINELEEATKNYQSKHLIMAIDYSGRFDILNACKNIVKKTEQGLIHEEDVDEKLIESELLTKCTEFSNPDLLIRTSGEQRISNFFLWQLAYTELFFSPVMWPDFGKNEFLDALVSYQRRERRFGANA